MSNSQFRFSIPETGIPIFIGASDHECDKIQEKILVYTLQKHSTAKLNITFLRASNFPKVSALGWGTPFTGLRYVIPKLMGYEGRAIYMDMDMINFRDIQDFYHINLLGKPFGMIWDSKQSVGDRRARGSYCDSMMLMDCEQASNFFNWDEVHNWYDSQAGFKWEFMKRLRKWEDADNPIDNKAVTKIDSRWNCFDGQVTDAPLNDKNEIEEQYSLEQVFQVHLTALSYQPWHSAYLMSAKATHQRPDITDYWWKLVDEVNNFDI